MESIDKSPSLNGQMFNSHLMMISRQTIYIFAILIYENLIITCSSFIINERKSTRSLCKDTHTTKTYKNIQLQSPLLHLHTHTQVDRCIDRYQTRLFMDHSSATLFEIGDTVIVVDDIMKSGRNLNGLSGKVTFTWEKCDVDPTCCCAEWVDEGLSVHVKFNVDDENNEKGDSLFANDTFIHYFAESELMKKKD